MRICISLSRGVTIPLGLRTARPPRRPRKPGGELEREGVEPPRGPKPLAGGAAAELSFED